MFNVAALKSAKNELSMRLLRFDDHQPMMHRMSGMKSIASSPPTSTTSHNVHAVGIGMKNVKGKATKQQCIRVHVPKKIPESQMNPKDIVPREINGIPTDIIESAPAIFHESVNTPPPPCSQNKQNRQRPVIGGISVGHFNITAGTIGCFCRSTKPGDDRHATYVLSNNHILANENQAQENDDIYQPGSRDGGGPADSFATLSRYVKLQLDSLDSNLVDAAIAKLKPDIDIIPEICSIGAITGTAEATLGMIVRKHGRTTGLTYGKITDLYINVNIAMGPSITSPKVTLNDQLRIEAHECSAIGLNGDSGSLIVKNDEAKAVGLYFAGPTNGEYGIANRIENVLSELEIALI